MVAGVHAPARFSFPNPIQDYYFQTQTMVIGTPDPAMFNVPNNCPPCSSLASAELADSAWHVHDEP